VSRFAAGALRAGPLLQIAVAVVRAIKSMA